MNYFKSLKKEDQKKVKVEFLKDKTASNVYSKVNKIFGLSIFGTILAIAAGVFDYLCKTGLLNYILDGLLFIFSIVFIIKTVGMKNGELNKYALSKKDAK